MEFTNAIDVLMNNACPSIQYRLRKDLLDESPNSSEIKELQEQILQDNKVKEIIDLQKEDGWLGGDFHGEKEPESGIRFLTEKGVEGRSDVISKALHALVPFDNALGRIGKILDAYHVGGAEMIKSCVFAYAGYEDYSFDVVSSH